MVCAFWSIIRQKTSGICRDLGVGARRPVYRSRKSGPFNSVNKGLLQVANCNWLLLVMSCVNRKDKSG